MRERYVLILVSLNPDETDLSGVEFPEFGHIESKDYQPDKDIRHGLYGTLWGRADAEHWLNSDEDAKWRVVKAENNDEIIPIDPLYNFVKFRKGMVVATGTRKQCSEYICTNCSQHKECDKSQCNLISLKIKTTEKDSHAVVRGAGAIAETNKAGSHAINLGDAGGAKAEGWGSHAISVGANSNAMASGEEGMAFTMGTHSRCIAPQNRGVAVNAAFSGFVGAGKRGCAVGIGECSIARAGVRGFIALKYNDGKRDRLKVGYVGEDIEADTMYRVTDSGEFEVVESPA